MTDKQLKRLRLWLTILMIAGSIIGTMTATWGQTLHEALDAL